MFEFIVNHLVAVILAAIALLAGIVLTVRFVNNSKKNSYKVQQTGNKVKGDMAGRDIKK